jgi:hypothetical protein
MIIALTSDKTILLVRFSVGIDFCLRHSVQTESGAHPASYPMTIEGFFPGSQAAGVSS